MQDLDLDSLLNEIAPEEEFLDVVNGDTLKPKREVKEDNGVRVYEALTVYDILPKSGLHLGLDISKNSTGVTLVREGKVHSFNIEIFGKEDSQFSEILLRRELKEKFIDSFGDFSFDTIVLEDTYEGVNPVTTRLLYSLNTVIDEMILDHDIYCDKFIRAGNQSWKSWLWSIEPQIAKGLDDKTRTEEVLKYLGVSEDGKGYQDRLDSLGMLVGYFYKVLKDDFNLFKVPKVRWSSVLYTLVSDLEDMVEIPQSYRSLPMVVVDAGNKNITKEYIKYLLATNKGKLVAITTSRDISIVKSTLDIPQELSGTLVVWGK